jgi:cytochrome c oxidase cbb3-type subunit 3
MTQKQSERHRDVLMDHEYDGIQEYDNPVPAWLAYMFYVTIAFSAVYTLYYGFNQGPSIQSAYLEESRQLEAQWAEYYKNNPMVPPTTDELVAAAKSPDLVAAGEKQFRTSCAACHGERGEGLIGPNLADRHWIHGGKLTEIYTTVVNGVAGKGMPPWGRALPPDRLKGVVAYVRTLQGTNPPGGKAPEGQLVEPDPI